MSLTIIESDEGDYALISDNLGNQAIHISDKIIFIGCTVFKTGCFRDILPLKFISKDFLAGYNSLEDLREFLILRNMEEV